jgi:hypothetical protein
LSSSVCLFWIFVTFLLSFPSFLQIKSRSPTLFSLYNISLSWLIF